MKTKFTFRKADQSDFEKLYALGKESYFEFSEILTHENWEKMKSSLGNDSALKNLIELSEVFVCTVDSEIIGMVYFVPSGNPTDIFQEDWSYIRLLGVKTKHRGKGIGSKLTDLCIEYAKNTHEKCIALHTSEFMNSARAIYEKRGFKKTKEIVYLGKRYWIYLYTLNESNHQLK